MNNKKLFLGLVLFSICFGKVSFSQIKYYKGYVILLNGDTLKGEVKKNLKKEFENFSKVVYRKKEGSEIKTLNPTKVKEYCIDGVTFVSRNIDGENVFVKRLSQGVVNLYESQFEVIVMNDTKIKSDYFVEKSGQTEPTKIKSGRFKKQMEELMADNETIKEGLDNKKYSYENIVEVFNEYNKNFKN